MNDITESEDLVRTLSEIGTCMLTTVDAEGRLVSRPMSIAHIDENNQFWFFSRVGAEKVDDIVGEGQVNLAFVKGKTWVSVAGAASVSTDETKKAELWELGARAYFVEGPEDAEAALILVQPESAQYWEGPGTAVALMKMTKASLGKEQPHMGDQGRVDL